MQIVLIKTVKCTANTSAQITETYRARTRWDVNLQLLHTLRYIDHIFTKFTHVKISGIRGYFSQKGGGDGVVAGSEFSSTKTLVPTVT